MQLVARMPRGVYRVLSRLLHYRMLRAALLIVNVVRYTMHAVRYNMLWSATTCGSPLQHAVRYNIAVVRYNMRRGANRSLFLRGFSGASVSSTGWSCTSPPPFHTGSTQGYSKGPSG